jgi:hypothetical protein
MRIAALLLALCGPVLAQREYVYQVRAAQCPASPVNRSLTGFRVRGEKGIVTALHGVVGCKAIRVKSDYGDLLTGPLTLSRFDVEADAALLVSDELLAKPANGINISRAPAAEGSRALVLGHPLDTGYHETDVIIRRPALRPLFQEVPGDVYEALRARNSPSVKLNILSIQGPVVPGHSGAPVVDMRGDLLGIADGGLKGGTVEQAWAIPYALVSWGRNASSGRLADLAENVDSLFKFQPFEEESSGPPDDSCQTLRRAIASGQRGFTDLIAAKQNYQNIIESSLNIPGAAFTLVTPNRYLTGRLLDFESHAAAQAAYYKAVSTISSCLNGWRKRNETGRELGIQFQDDHGFVVRIACDRKLHDKDETHREDYYVDDCSIILYPPAPGGARSADAPKLSFADVLVEMVEYARKNFIGFGGTDTAYAKWQPFEQLPGARCEGSTPYFRRGNILCELARQNSWEGTERQFTGVLYSVQSALGNGWTRGDLAQRPGSQAVRQVLFVDAGNTASVLVEIWKQSDSRSIDRGAFGIRIYISKR